jgi:Flp pilus assembly protein TadG
MKRNNRVRELGQGLVEFAVIFPLFIFFLAAIFDVGLGFNRQATIQHAVREGARYGSVRDNSDAGALVLQRTMDQSHGLLDASEVCYDYSDVDGDGELDAIDVTATYVYQPIFLKTIDGLFNSNMTDITMEITGSARLETSLDDESSGAPC